MGEERKLQQNYQKKNYQNELKQKKTQEKIKYKEKIVTVDKIIQEIDKTELKIYVLAMYFLYNNKSSE